MPKVAVHEKLRKLADGMENTIQNKLNPGSANQNPTPRRMRIADSMRREGERLQRVQILLRRLADLHEAGTVPEELAGITTKSAAEEAFYSWGGETPAKIAAKKLIEGAQIGEDPKKKFLREVEQRYMRSRIPGFFVTPEDVALKMIGLANIQPGNTVLEPSAGLGHIAMHINHGSILHCVEIVHDLAEVLQMRGLGEQVFCRDFLEHDLKYDRIIMNPPFEHCQDIDHVLHAYGLLNPGGRLVAIMGEGAFFRQNRKETEFREWLTEEVYGSTQQLSSGAFMGTITPTGVATRIVVIGKR